MSLVLSKPEGLSEQLLQAVANSLINNTTLQVLMIAVLFHEVQSCILICERIEAVKWKAVKAHEDERVIIYWVDFK